MTWRTTLGIVLLIAAIISGWSAWRLHKSNEATVAVEEQPFDYILHDFEMISLDKQGRENITLHGSELQRRRDDQTFAIVSPLFLIPDDQGRYWQLRADTGWVSPKGEELRLHGNVSGDSPESPDIIPTTFRSVTLTVQPEQELAFTSDQVTVSQPGIMQTGIGFEAQLKTREYRLLSHVQVRYEPSARR
ncbi:MAG: LPS export ABC transporter periplasmic protein LptC [Xanthomonadaceae bacterium]|jgi:lipopolysaccharide export system protein LptC|nr:LPS export ABC transporter periplasmic protein LptC [Xanthomonadaceae bacterium]